MKKIFSNSLLMLATAALAVSCADYNEIDGFSAEPDPTVVAPYADLEPVKNYVDREKYPNMTLGVTLKVSEFNKQELAHAAAITNFDNLSFGTTLMSGAIVNSKGIMNFLDMKDLLDHVDELDAEVFGSPIAANTAQADDWLNTLTAPVKIQVDYIDDARNDFTKAETFEGTVTSGKEPTFTTVDGIRCLEVQDQAKFYLAEGFETDLDVTYDITMKVKASKAASLTLTFAGTKLEKLAVTDKWKEYSFTAKATELEGNLFCDQGRLKGSVYYASVKIGHYPDNHRPQTAEEKNDAIHYALNAWCDGLMKINEGRIKLFDLIEDAIAVDTLTEEGFYALKHSTDKIYWQDILGNENYAPVVAQYAREAFQQHGGNLDDLKLFISESNLDDEKRFESLKHWINVWDAKGAKIEGISAKLNIPYYEDSERQDKKRAAVDKMLENLASTGKLIRLSDFDIKYNNAEGSTVAAKDLTDEQRQKVADYYGYILKSYMSKIPSDKQAGICKGNMSDTGDNIGLWSVDKKSEWHRTAVYKAFCDALSGK